jgi:hypothetical protein
MNCQQQQQTTEQVKGYDQSKKKLPGPASKFQKKKVLK